MGAASLSHCCEDLCSSRDSGIVCVPGYFSSPTIYSIVPIKPTLPSIDGVLNSSNCLMGYVVVVFHLFQSHRSIGAVLRMSEIVCRHYRKRPPRAADHDLYDSHVHEERVGEQSSSFSMTTALAPFATAVPIWLCPSASTPLIAINMSPSRTFP